LIESTDDLWGSVGLDHRLIIFNRAFASYIREQYGVELAVGMRLEEIIPAEKAEFWHEALDRALVEGAFRTEYALLDGRTLELAFHPILSDGQATGVTAFGKDITAQKAAQRALLEAEKRYREIFDGALVGMFQISLQSKLLHANQALATILGYESAAQLIAELTNVGEQVWSDEDEHDRFVGQLRYQGRVHGFECRLRRRDGTIFWASVSSRRVSDTEGRPLYNEGSLEDISARVLAEETIREDRENLKKAQLFGNFGVYVLDVASGKWSCTSDLDAIFGIDTQYARTVEGWTNLIDPRDRAMMARYLAEEVIGRRQPFEKEYRIVRQRDGAQRWVMGAGRLEFDDAGHPLKMRGIIMDITERKLAAQAVAEREARLRKVFEENGSIMLQVDPESGRIVDANAAAAIFYGYGREELLGMSIDHINTMPREEIARERQRALQEECNHFNFRHRLASGEEREVEVYTSPVYIDQHPVLFSIVHDITERRRAERQLRDSEEQFRATFEQAAIGISHVSADGVFLRCNRRFAEIVGYPLDEITGMTTEQITPFEERADSRAARQKVFEGSQEAVTFEKRYIRKDGEITWVKLTISAQRDEQGRPVHLVGFTEDINEQKVAKKRLAVATEAMWSSEVRYRTVFHTSIDMMAITRMDDGTYIDVNRVFYDMMGYEREEIIGHSSLDLDIWVDPCERKNMLEILEKESTCHNLEVRFKRKDGRIIWCLVSSTVIPLEGVRCLLTVVRDNTEAKAAAERMAVATEALRKSEERYRTAFQTSLDSMSITTLDEGRYIDVNPAFLHIFGYKREEVIGKTVHDLHIWDNPEDRKKMVEALLQENTCSNMEVQLQRKSGMKFWVLVSAARIDLDGVPCIYFIVRDISEAKAAAEVIENLAFFDPLTHLPNRRMLLDRLNHAVASSARNGNKRALLFIDLDNFKTINDTLGHKVGDLMLEEVAQRMVACVRKSDTVARLGGDEFVVMLEELGKSSELSATQARIVGEKLLVAIEKPYLLAGRECRSRASIGIAVFGSGRESSDEILQQADIAMYQAKTAGRGTLRFFAPALQTVVNARALLEHELHQAIQERQFVLFYQPQVRNGQVWGCEALIRWNHPRRGLLAPGEFIAQAEETGQILAIGNWVLEQACEQIALWNTCAEAAHLMVAVNISARQFRQPNFEHQVLKALKHTNANPHNLKLELTETMLADNIEEIITKMNGLREHGVGFSLDDFGTGYSSLSYLKRLPLDQLKIDRSFINDILLDVSSGAIVQTIISLGRALGISVIAEGVETVEQREFLACMDCHTFQGYLVSRPLPLKEFEALLKRMSEGAEK